jgi:aryl-alcohol dehydrogenase-like predicted oxidoreductase/RimJ/RimL family protein N-acetyltransferase
MIFKTLKINKNLLIKKFNIKYINYNYLNWFKDRHIKKFINFSPKNIEQLKIDCLKKIGCKSKIFLAIEYKKKHIGNVLVHDINYLKKSCFVGILIGEKKFRNIKIGSKVLKYLAKKIFSKNKINKIYLGVAKKNIIAIKSYFNIGFKIFDKKKNNYILVLNNNISNKLILGTVQFGMPYGIANNINRKVNIQEQRKIFSSCKRFGINEIDTAQSYNFDINILPKNNIWLVNTKIEISKFSNKQQIVNYLNSFRSKNIILNYLYIHDEENLFTKRGKVVLNILYKLKKAHLFNKIGVSVYNFKNLKSIVTNFKIDAIQVPFNILDTKIKKYTEMLVKKNIDIHVRSIFLQGLLLMKPHLIPKEFLKIKKYILKINEQKKIYNTSLVNYLLNFVDKQDFVKKIVFGVYSYSHLQEIIRYKRFSRICFNKFNLFNKKIIDPRTW